MSNVPQSWADVDASNRFANIDALRAHVRHIPSMDFTLIVRAHMWGRFHLMRPTRSSGRTASPFGEKRSALRSLVWIVR